MYKAVNILISPIKAVLNDLEDTTIDFILCTSGTVSITEERSNILLLHFADIEEENNPFRFREYHAERIVSFLSRPDAKEDLFVCCDSGESRSSAIAAAVLLAVGKRDRHIWESTEYHPNLLVFRTMCERLGVALTDDDIQNRKENNETVFREAIRSHMF